MKLKLNIGTKKKSNIGGYKDWRLYVASPICFFVGLLVLDLSKRLYPFEKIGRFIILMTFFISSFHHFYNLVTFIENKGKRIKLKPIIEIK